MSGFPWFDETFVERALDKTKREQRIAKYTVNRTVSCFVAIVWFVLAIVLGFLEGPADRIALMCLIVLILNLMTTLNFDIHVKWLKTIDRMCENQTFSGKAAD